MGYDLKAAIYCRVSTDNQEREGTSLHTQLEACLKYCESKGYEIGYQACETFSGSTLERPKLDEARQCIRSREVDVLVVHCLDRLSRDPVHGVILSEELEKYDVSLESVTETVESNEVGRLINYIRGFASKLESEKIRERTKRGKDDKLKDGRMVQGTGKGLYGYSWDRSGGKWQGKRTILEGEAAVVRRIFQMAIEGKSVNGIAVALNDSGARAKGEGLWHPRTVKAVLINECYIGLTFYGKTKRVSKSKVVTQPIENWVPLPNATPPIITQEIFEAAQRAIAKAKEARPLKTNASYLLTGFIKCAKCGSPIGGTTLQGKYRYYQCRGARPTSTREKICDARYIKADEVEEWTWWRVSNFAKHPLTWVKLFLEAEFDSENVLPLLEQQIKRLRQQVKQRSLKEKELYSLLASDAVTKDYVLDTVNDVKRTRAEEQKQLEGLERQRKELGRASSLSVRLTERWHEFHEAVTEAKTLEDKRQWLSDLEVSVAAVPGEYVVNCFIDCELTGEDWSMEAEPAGHLITAYQDKMTKLMSERPDLFPNGQMPDLPWNQPANDVLFSGGNWDAGDDLVTIGRTSG